MGTKCAPTYANLVLGVVEQEFLATRSKKPRCFLRFIDDIFGVWPYSQTELVEFVDAFNSLYESLKLTLESSTQEVVFLDTVVRKQDKSLITGLYRKPTDTTNYLMYKSAHPDGCKKGFYSQLLRIRRNCAQNEEFEKHISALHIAYRERGYPEAQLQTDLTKVRSINRSSLLTPKEHNEENSEAMVCTLPYNQLNVNARKIVLEHWYILSDSPRLGTAFETPPTFGYTRPKNFRDILCSSKFEYPKDQRAVTGTSLNLHGETCTREHCKWCEKITQNQRIKSCQTKDKHRKILPIEVDCGSCNLIYVITCVNCRKQYVGETKRSFRDRITEHDRDIRLKKDTTLSKHFNAPHMKCSWDNIKLDIVELIFGDPTHKSNLRLQRETNWIVSLQTLEPQGLNVKLGRPF